MTRCGASIAQLTGCYRGRVNVPIPDDRLPRGPHRLTRDEVADSQRGRLYLAALDAVAEHGYQALTVADLVTRAKISRRTFYELFDSKDACFSAAFEVLVEVATGRLGQSVGTAPQSDWRELVRTSLTAYLAILTEEPAAARTLHVEALLAGPAFAAYRTRLMTVFAARMRAAREIGVEQGELTGELPDETYEFLIGGIDDRIRNCLLTSGPDALPTLAPALIDVALILLGSPGH
ncbi:TetR/AcrR family transcriptional regulator [Nocardia sp. NBC_00511]|uniref:TetR/AcrR family transcriptional regulator n=1 Tax=Nocardia sp. NBC_00511 TaxID=2903591 RepID=UPI0030E1B52D